MWTRNFKNIITTLAFCVNAGYDGASTNAFGDGYYFNFIAPDGTVREICSINKYSSSDGNATVHPFILREMKAANAFSSTPRLLINETEKVNYLYDGFYLCFGSSANEASEEDYTLGSAISTLTLNSASGAVTLNTDGTLTVDYQAIVTASADCAIQEIGIYIPVPNCGTSGNGNIYRLALINRVVLDEPVSIASGNVGNVTFSITTPKISFA